MELGKEYIKLLGIIIGKGQIELQPHIAQKILDMPNKLEGLEQIQEFLGLLNYARPFIRNLSKLVGPINNKTKKNGSRNFDNEDIKIMIRIKEEIKKILKMEIPLDIDYLIIEIDGSLDGWGTAL